MKKWLSICINDGALIGWISFIVSISLIITSFILPPTGSIDPSVLMAVGELFGFGVLFKLPNMVQSIRDGKSLTVKHGETEFTVSSTKDNVNE